MDRRLIKPFNEVEMHVAHHYQYAWNRFLVMIEEKKLKISDAEKHEVKNYIFHGDKIKSASVFQESADKCLLEAKERFDGKD
jgi:hypothetical protein